MSLLGLHIALLGLQKTPPITIPLDASIPIYEGFQPNNLRSTTAGAGRIALTWFSNGRTAGGVYYSFSEDGGETFSRPRIISDSSALDLEDIQITANKTGRVWVGYRQGSKFYVLESADGKVFSKTKRVLRSDVPDLNSTEEIWIDSTPAGLAYAIPTSSGSVVAGIVSGSPSRMPARTTTLTARTGTVYGVKIYGGDTTRVLIKQNIGKSLPALLMAQSQNGGRTYEQIDPSATYTFGRHTISEADSWLSHPTDRPTSRSYVKLISAVSNREYDMVFGPDGREWISMESRHADWGVTRQFILTSVDPSRGVFRGGSSVIEHWRNAVSRLPRPEGDPRDERMVSLGVNKQYVVFKGSNFPTIIGLSGYLARRSPGTIRFCNLEASDLEGMDYEPGTRLRWMATRPRMWPDAVVSSRIHTDSRELYSGFKAFNVGRDALYLGTRNWYPETGPNPGTRMFRLSTRVGWERLHFSNERSSHALSGTVPATVVSSSNPVVAFVYESKVWVRRLSRYGG